MKIARVLRKNKEEYGIIKNSNWFPIDSIKRNDLGIESFLHQPLAKVDQQPACSINDEDISWLPPIARPEKIICVGRNYVEHSKEQGKKQQDTPILFAKFPSSMTGHLSSVPYPDHTSNFDYEVELAVIIGKQVTKLAEGANPLDCVFGYTVANDLTARDVQKSEKQWTRGKAFDNSLPIGPYIITTDEISDIQNKDIWLTVNSEKRQLSNTEKMMFNVEFLIRYISQTITLNPGDIILTGTPAGVGFYMDPKATLQSGDYIACGITDVGELRFKIS